MTAVEAPDFPAGAVRFSPSLSRVENSQLPRGVKEMVISSAPSSDTKPQVRHNLCPRCDASLVSTYYEPQCLQCGYVDYSYSPPTQIGRKNLLSSSTRYVFRYIGDFPKFAETLAHVQVRRLRNRIVFGVTCPFCKDDVDMEPTSLSGRRKQIREERYRCRAGHRVSLIPRRDGSMGWK